MFTYRHCVVEGLAKLKEGLWFCGFLMKASLCVPYTSPFLCSMLPFYGPATTIVSGMQGRWKNRVKQFVVFIACIFVISDRVTL